MLVWQIINFQFKIWVSNKNDCQLKFGSLDASFILKNKNKNKNKNENPNTLNCSTQIVGSEMRKNKKKKDVFNTLSDFQKCFE